MRAREHDEKDFACGIRDEERKICIRIQRINGGMQKQRPVIRPAFANYFDFGGLLSLSFPDSFPGFLLGQFGERGALLDILFGPYLAVTPHNLGGTHRNISLTGTFRDMTTQELQTAIKAVIRELGWSLARIAERIYYELDGRDNKKEMRRFVESFKKQLSRKTTRPGVLKSYLNALRGLDAVQKLGIVIPNYIPSGHLDRSLQKRLQAISRDLDRERRRDSDSEA